MDGDRVVVRKLPLNKSDEVLRLLHKGAPPVGTGRYLNQARCRTVTLRSRDHQPVETQFVRHRVAEGEVRLWAGHFS